MEEEAYVNQVFVVWFINIIPEIHVSLPSQETVQAKII